MSHEDALPLNDPAKKRLRGHAILFGAAIWVCGLIMGGAGTFYFVSRHPMDMPPGPPEHMAEHITQRLRHDLGLNDQQAQAVLEIFTRSHEKLEAIRLKVDPEVQTEMDAVRGEVDALLDPGQKEKWGKRFLEMRDRFRPRPPGGRHPGKHTPDAAEK